MTSPSPTLFDAEARAIFTETLDENFCVSAGAGVGKTTAIVRRIANLALLRREPINLLPRLVVVTYGKLAAEELRIRTRDILLQQLDKSVVGRQMLLADLRSAFFGTIHSFCLKLIRDEGRFLGLPETIGLLEDREAAQLWERFCESDALLNLALPPVLLERVSRHLTFEQLLDLAQQLGPDEIENSATADDSLAPPPVPDFSMALDNDGGRSKEKTREHQRALRRWQQEFSAGAAFLELPEFKGGSSSFLVAVEQALEPYARWLNTAAGHLAVAIAKAYRDFRLDKGLMTFRDQVYWCRRLVADPMVLNRLRLRGYLVILDEAQDTDAEMFSILTEITRPIGSVPGSWPVEEAAPGPEPGRFSFVGDDQQAIYSERADLAVYRQYVDAFKSGNSGRHLEFSVTMRCPQRVVRVVNAIFANGRLPQPYVDFRELSPRPDAPIGASWLLDLGAIQQVEGRSGVEARLTHESERIADFLRTQGQIGLGVSDWSEVAVICPRVRWLEIAAQIFEENGLPGCLLSQKRTAREMARCSWPAALFHVLLHPWDRFELIGVLREIFSISDVDMARLHRRDSSNGEALGLAFWPHTPEKSKSGIPSSRLLHALHLLHELRAQMPQNATANALSPSNSGAVEKTCPTLSRYVEVVLEKTALATRLEAIGETSRSLDELRAGALRAECDGMTLRGWVHSLVNVLDEPASAQSAGEDGIQFLTCLKAKGLEWPVVIPLGLGCEIRERSEHYPRLERHSGATQIHFSKVTVDPQRKAERASRRAEEFQRMLYVTLTRAERLLLVPDTASLYDGREPNFLGLSRWNELDTISLFTPASAVPLPSQIVEPSDDLSVGPALFRDNKRRLNRAGEISRQIPRRILPSSLVHSADAIVPSLNDAPVASEDQRALASEEAALMDADCETPVAGIGGIDYGNWWHAVLQRYPWTAKDANIRASYLDEQFSKIAASTGWTTRAKAELLLLTASKAHADWLEHGEIFLPEMPFSHPRSADEWIEGIMDLVIVTQPPHDLWIVDWKTDRRWSSDTSEETFLARLAETYGPQLRAYAEVFARGFGRPVSRLQIYSTAVGAVVDVTAS